MSNFGKWRMPGALEAFEQEQLARRLEKSEIIRKETPGGTEITMVKVRPGKPRKTSKQNPEYQIQAEFVAKMANRHPGVMVFSDTAAHIGKTMFQQIRANKLQSEIAKDWPDVFVAQPSGDYAGLFLEFKAKTPYLKDSVTLSSDKHIRAQAATMDRLRERGFFCAFVWDVSQAITITDKYLNQ